MAHLDNLPHEISAMICQKTPLQDKEALATCNNHLKAIVQREDEMLQHWGRKKNPYSLTIGDYVGTPTSTYPIQDLARIAEEKYSYVHKMRLGALDDEWMDTQDDAERQVVIDDVWEKYGEEIEGMVAEVHDAIRPNKSAANWVQMIQDGDATATVLLIMACSRGLVELDILDTGRTWPRPDDCGDIFEKLVSTGAASSLRCFGRLNRLYLDSTDDNRLRADADMIKTLMGLPSVRILSGKNADGPERGMSLPQGISAVQEIRLERCDIEPACYREILQATKVLKKFHTTFKPGWSSDNEWQPRLVLEYAIRYTADTLVSLVLGALAYGNTEVRERVYRAQDSFHDEDVCIGSLKAFKCLTHVSLDTVMVFQMVEDGKVGDATTTTGDDAPASAGTTPGDSQSYQLEAHRLADIMPKSIERIVFTWNYVGEWFSERDIRCMFDGVGTFRHELPNLAEIGMVSGEEIKLEDVNAMLELLIFCDSLDIELVLMNRGEVTMTDIKDWPGMTQKEVLDEFVSCKQAR